MQTCAAIMRDRLAREQVRNQNYACVPKGLAEKELS
jgi:hypothetical protein